MVEALSPKPHLTLALHRTWTRAAESARAIMLPVRVHAGEAEPLGGRGAWLSDRT